MAVQIDWKQAELVFGRILEDLENKRFPYDRVQVPQLPENLSKNIRWGSVEHARFLFCVCYYMRGGIESHTAFKNLKDVFDKHPELFDPAVFGRTTAPTSEDITKVLVENSLGYNAVQVGEHWVYNFQKMYVYWGGNPANLFREVRSFDDACLVVMHGSKRPRSHGFYGFREKMVSMIIYFLRDAGIIDQFLFPVPVDFHVLRLLVSNEIIDDPEAAFDEDIFTKKLQAAARKVTSDYCEKHGVDPLRLADALWLRSLGLCKNAPGNFRNIGERNGRRTLISEVPLTWSRSELRAYLKTCGRCVLNPTCRSNVPSAPYYVQGKLIRKKRDKPNLLF